MVLSLYRRSDFTVELTWAQLDSNWTVIENAINSLNGLLVYQGIWDANANNPILASGTGTQGFFYRVGTAGSTTLDGVSIWNPGDLLFFNGTIWEKVDGIANESITIGTTNILLGGTATILAGLTSVTSSSFIGPLTGNASTATSLAGGDANQIIYQSGAGVSAYISPANYGILTTSGTGVPSILAGATGVLVGSASAVPSWSTTPTLTGTNFSNIPGTAINSVVSKATNLAGGNSTTLLGSIPYQSNTDTTTLLTPNTTTTKKFLTQTGSGTNGAAPVYSTIATSDIATALTTPGAIGGTTPSTGQFTTSTFTQKVNFTAYANTPVLGDMWYNSTQQTFCTSEGASGNPITTYKPSVIAIVKSTSAITFAVATTYYPILTNVLLGSLTLPIGTFVVGKTVIIPINGVITIVTTASTVTAQVQIGSTNITFPASASLAAGSYNFNLEIKASLTAAGYLQGMGTLIIALQGGSSITSYGTINIPSTTAITTTVTNTIGCSFQTASATTSSTIIANPSVIETKG